MRAYLLLVPGLMALLAGCQTPAAVIVQANHTTKLMVQLEEQAAGFRRAEQAAEVALMQSMVTQRQSFAVFVSTAELDDQSRLNAGDAKSQALRELLLKGTDQYGASVARAKKAPEDAEKAVKALLDPLPSTTAALTGAQEKAAAFAKELDPDVRRQELLDFLKAVKEGVDASRKKVADAMAAANKEQGKADSGATLSATAAGAPTVKP